jgi:hypothetical protein
MADEEEMDEIDEEEMDEIDAEETDDEEIEEDPDINEIIDSLITSYQDELLDGVTNANLQAVKEAAENSSLTKKELAIIALDQAEKWYNDLIKKGGSEVVIDHENIAFVPWLDNLKTDLKAELAKIATDAIKNNWSMNQINDAVRKIEIEGLRRSALAAEHEILRNVDKVRRDVWKKRGIKMVMRHSSGDGHVCGKCTMMSGSVSTVGDAEPLPAHSKCRCYYEPFSEDEG